MNRNNIKNTDNGYNYWVWFMMNKQEDLYNVISSMIRDKINELLPKIIDE